MSCGFSPSTRIKVSGEALKPTLVERLSRYRQYALSSMMLEKGGKISHSFEIVSADEEKAVKERRSFEGGVMAVDQFNKIRLHGFNNLTKSISYYISVMQNRNSIERSTLIISMSSISRTPDPNID